MGAVVEASRDFRCGGSSFEHIIGDKVNATKP